MTKPASLDKFVITPHPDAPILSSRKDAQLHIDQLFKEIQSPNPQFYGEVTNLIREAGLVNLYFFLKVICAYAGPYDRLNEDLHLDMCNFRQLNHGPGARAAAAISRGFYKSECAGSRVLTRNFYKNVEDVVPGDELLTRKGYATVKGVSSSKEPCFEVTLRSGRVLVGADHHKVKTLLDWASLEDLSPGDHVVLDLSPAPTTTVFDIHPDMAWLLGCVYGDGAVTGGMVHITNTDSEVLSEIKRIWPNHSELASHYRISLRGGIKWWKSLGLPKDKAINKVYPEICEGNPFFLRGLFDTDGHANKRGNVASYCTASKDLALGICRNLGRLGIFSSIHEFKSDSEHGVFYHVTISGRKEVLKFAHAVGSTIQYKKDRLFKDAPQGPSVRDFVPKEWKGLIPEGGCSKIRNSGIRIDNNYNHTKEKVLRVGELLGCRPIMDLSDEDVIYDKVKRVEFLGNRMVYHIEMKEYGEYQSDLRVVNHNSTIFSHGANTWILNRDPEQRIALVNAIVDKAQDFKRISHRTFDSNEFFQFLYPHNAVPKNQGALVLPSRKREYAEPSLKVLGATGSAEGGHYTGIDIDDLIGLEDIDKEFKSNANMLSKIKWASTNTRALLDSPSRSWITWVFTLYATDDVYHRLILDKNMKSLTGYMDPDLLIKVNDHISEGDDAYNVYYRCILEDGEAIFAEEGFTKAWYESLLKENKWTAMAQYMNKPTEAGLTEFYKMPVKRCRMFFDESKNDWYIVRFGMDGIGEQMDRLKLSECDVVMSIDPAGTDTGITAKTSRTSIGVWAMDHQENVYRIWGKVGYLAIEQMFDKIFEGHGVFPGYIRGTFVESNAMQKILAPLIASEQAKRKQYVNPQPVFAKGDKEARIRSTIGYYLSQGKVWLADGHGTEFIEEKDLFPMSSYRLDVLDESEKALTILRKPLSPSEYEEYEQQDARYEEWASSNCVGY